jgi:hypothetical protein
MKPKGIVRRIKNMLNRNSNLVLWLGVLAVLALSLPAGATSFNFPTSSITNYTGDVTKWETTALPHTYPTAADFLNPGNTWTIHYKQAKVGAPGTPGTNTRIVGPVIFHGGVGVSGTNFDRPLLFNGNDGSTYDLVNTFDDLRFQGTIRGEVSRRPTLAGNLRFTTDANGLPSHSAIQVRAGQQLNITARIDAADCPSIDIVYNAFIATSNFADSQISLRNSNNRIYSKFVLESGLYGNVNGSLGDADVEINGSSALDYRAGKLILQTSQAIATTAKVSIITDATGMNHDPNRIDVGGNNVAIRELWIDGVKQTGTPVYTTASTPTWLHVTGAGSLSVTNTATRNVNMATSPSGEPNLRIFPPVGTKAYAQGYTVALSAPTPGNAPYIFKNWTCAGGTVVSPTSANTTVTVPTGSDITVTAVYDGAACSAAPVDTQVNISVFTSLSWTASPAATAQTVYFGTTTTPGTVVTNVGNTVSNAALGGRLADNVTYYWRVDSTIGGVVIAGPVWSFVTANSVPNSPSPAVGSTLSFGASAAGIQLLWSEDPGVGTTTHLVYFSTNQTAVANRTAPTLDPNSSGAYLTGPLVQGQTYYWAVDTNYGGLGTSTGPVWNFNSSNKILYIKTEIAGYNINGTGDANGVANGCYVDDANVVIYKFPTFSYGSGWDIVVSGTKAFAIWLDSGDISIGGMMDVSGHAGASGNTGGLGGPGGYSGVTGHSPPPQAGTASLNGPGRGSTTEGEYKNGSGAGYGGIGGNAGRYSPLIGGGLGGDVYGELELYTLWGGSGGGSGRASGDSAGGGGGGGAVELYAKSGNISVASTAVITSNGGTPLVATNYAGGGGSGGSVRFIASGNVTVAGAIAANGGNGGSINKTGDAVNCGGGGGGGRIAIYKGGAFTQTGTIAVAGGLKGLNIDVPPAGMGTDGAAGTIYTAGAPSTLLVAHNPRPTNGDVGWALDPNFGGQVLSWTPAIGTTQNKVYFSTVQADVVNGAAGALKATINAAANSFLRARKTFTPSPLLTEGKTYYWRIDTNGTAGTVWGFSISQRPYGPTPAVGATGVDIHNPALKWIPGGPAPTSWDVYLGTNSGAMTKIATMAAPYNTAGVPAGELAVNKTYYWRVDEKPIPSGTPPTGIVWNFVTRGPLCTSGPTADLNGDCKVTFRDFAVVAADWAK